jgi:hypothetical protein
MGWFFKKKEHLICSLDERREIKRIEKDIKFMQNVLLAVFASTLASALFLILFFK